MAKRGRPPGSKNKPKNGAPPSAGSQPGHNSGGDLTEEERRRRFVIGLTEIEKFKEAAASANGKARNERQRLIAAGFTTDQIDFAIKLRSEKPDEAVERWRRLQQAARYIQHPIGTQPDMFGEADGAQSDVDVAMSAGALAGLEGKSCNPPHDAGSALGQAWIEGWHKGSAERTQHFKNAVDGNGVADDDAGAAAAEGFSDAVGNQEDGAAGESGEEPAPPTSDRQSYAQQLHESNSAVEKDLRAQADVMAGIRQPPEIPDEMKVPQPAAAES